MPENNRSLMDYIQTPILVGDPEGRAVYVNPAFETDFLTPSEEIVGQPLANFFDGGGREAVLHAVAEVCGRGDVDAKRFGLMVQDRGYRALCSPVEAEGGNVGVILLLTAETAGEGRVQAFRREMLGPLDELEASLVGVGESANDEQRVAIADGMRNIERIRKWAGAVAASLQGEAKGSKD